MITKIIAKPNEYRDSVFLMVINQEARKAAGVEELVLMMATDNNKGIMRDVGFAGNEVESASANDLLICIRAQSEEVIQKTLSTIENMLTREPSKEHLENVYKTLDAVMRDAPDTNLALISIPGEFAAREAKKALGHGLNVLLFSDNVSVDDEIELKILANEKDRIVMGPDCGTAIINQCPLAFANAVRPGPVGIVAAAGTGLQEVTCLLDREGEGISQAIGTGGRDLSDAVGGLSMMKGIDILENDAGTEVIVLISKPPGPNTERKVLDRVSLCQKPVIVCFLGGDQNAITESGAVPAQYLEEAAMLAVAAVREQPYSYKNYSISESELNSLLKREIEGMAPEQRYARGLFSGGTLCDEAMLILSDSVGKVYSNIPLNKDLIIPDIKKGFMNSCIDLGDDYFTRGKPHPMISPESRSNMILSESRDREVAVLLFDLVLGYGAHADMAGALIESILKAKAEVEKRNGYLSVVASITGTKSDPQNFEEQKDKLQSENVIVMPSNAQAARFASMIILEINNDK